MERQFRLRTGRASKIHKDAESVRGVNQQLNGVLTQLRQETFSLLDRISAITNIAKSRGMSVPKLSPEGRKFVIAGTASSFDVVFDYSAELRKTGLFHDVLVLRLDAVDNVGLDLPGGFPAVLFQVQVLIDIKGSLLQEEEPGVGLVRPK
jgi:hypothetical protein